MFDSGKKLNILTLVLSEKKILNETKNHNPSPLPYALLADDHVNNIINKEQIGFMKGRRTTDHMFVLKTLIDKYVERNSKPLYACFVDFKSAFGTVWYQGLLYKLKAARGQSKP